MLPTFRPPSFTPCAFLAPSTAFARAAISLRSPRDGGDIHGRSRACPAIRQGATRQRRGPVSGGRDVLGAEPFRQGHQAPR
jgi:hypothetical protein